LQQLAKTAANTAQQVKVVIMKMVMNQKGGR
jgi:hypothetical protein